MTSGADRDLDAISSEAVDWVIKIHSGEADSAVRAQLDRWLARSERHAAAYRRACLAWQLTGDLPPSLPAHSSEEVAVSGGVVGGVRARRPVRARAATGKTHLRSSRDGAACLLRRRLIAGLVAGAAATGLILAVCSTWPLISIEADFATRTAETRQIALSDGSEVDLGARAAIAVKFSPIDRQITLLTGEVFFTAAHSNRRPFLVRAGPIAVATIGTAFDVALRARTVEVAVQEGSVRVTPTDGHPDPAQRLLAGDRLVLDRRTGEESRGSIPPTQVGAWRRGKLIVEGVPIRQAIDEIGLYYHGLIIADGEALTRRKVTGIYDLQDPADALTAVVAPYGGTVTHITPFVLVVSGG
jgi:transmembrane sensor